MFALAALAVLWTWWALQDGAYFADVMLAGLVGIALVVALMAIFAPWRARLRLSPPALVALLALTGLGVWTAVSATWSPAPDVAIGDGHRVVVYALAYGMGLWICNLLGARMDLALAPLVIAGGFAGIATLIALVGKAPVELLEIDGSLDYPLGYRNANAAFFALVFVAAVGLASERRLGTPARALSVGAATLSLELALLSQSRAWVPAMALGLFAFVVAAPDRLRAASWLALAALPAAAIVSPLTELFAAVNGASLAAAEHELLLAAATAAASTAVAVALGLLATRYEARLPGLRSHGGGANRAVLGALAALVGVAGLGFVAVVGDPVDWIGERAHEFREAGSPDLGDEASRFTFNAGSDRYDLWRVGLERWADAPLLGEGGGAFQYAYSADREVIEQNARDAHSVEVEHLSELGLVGFALFAIAVVAAALAAVRGRRLGPVAGNLAAVALAAGVYWLVHASLDWFWPYPALTAPAFMLLGAAAAPAVHALAPARQRWRAVLVGGMVVVAGTAVPFLASDRYIDQAYEAWREDPARAYDALELAAELNPFSDTPLLVKGAIANASGERERAIAAFQEAVSRRPEEYWGHVMLARLLAESDPGLARREARISLELNPGAPEVRELAQRLGVTPSGG